MDHKSDIADLRERRQRAEASAERHMEATKAALGSISYEVVPKRRRAGRVIGYVMLAALAALSVAAFVGAVGLALWVARWAVGQT